MTFTSFLMHWSHVVISVLPWLAVGMVISVVLAILTIILVRLITFLRLLHQPAVFLEIVPPASGAKTVAATQELFSVLHGLGTAMTLKDRWLLPPLTISLELVSTRDRGIRYILRVPQTEAPTIKQQISSYLSNAKVSYTTDPLSNLPAKRRYISFKQTGHYAFPLQTQLSFEQNDPIAYISGSLTKLAPDELVAMQFVIRPTSLPGAEAISKKILGNEDLLAHISRDRSFGIGSLVYGINKLIFGAIDLIGEATHSASPYSYNATTFQRDYREQRQIAQHLKPARTLSVFEQQLVESINEKVRQPLFRTDIRALVVSNIAQQRKQRAKAIQSALASFSVPKYQAIRARSNHPVALRSRYRQFSFDRRLPSLFHKNNSVLASSELVGMYHFPNNRSTQTENLITSLSRTLPAPVTLKNGTKLEVLLGKNNHQGSDTPIGLTSAERERHVYIIGGTGNGKTTLLQYAIVQDMQSGKGIAVVDPHGDMAETLLKHVPANRVKDVIYFNPDNLAYPIGMNLLELTDNLSGDELLREKDLITESVISVFRKIFSDEDAGGHRIEYVLRNTIQTALTVPESTLFTIFRLLNDPKYRKNIVKTLENEDLKNFWKNEIGKAGEFQRVKMAAGITAKIGRFLFSASAKRILEQPKSTIDFDDIINSGKILICNFSKGLLGEDTSELFGITVLAKLQLASLRRARIQRADRQPFYLYVDEFQNFATPSFVQMLSESRKYKLFMTMAEQSTQQQDDQKLVNIILANVGTIVVFRTGSPKDEELLLPLFEPYIEKGEISNLSAYNFYCRITSVEAQEPMSGETIVL